MSWIKTHSLGPGEAVYFGARHAADYLVVDGDAVDFADWCGLRRRGNNFSYPSYANVLGVAKITNNGRGRALVLEVAKSAPVYADTAPSFWWEGTDDGDEEHRQQNIVRLMYLSCGSGGRDHRPD